MDVEKWRLGVAEELGGISSQLKDNRSYMENLHAKVTCIDNKLSGNGKTGLLTRVEVVENQYNRWEIARKSKVVWYYATTTAMLAVIVREAWCWLIDRR